jgi:hypothetical protein
MVLIDTTLYMSHVILVLELTFTSIVCLKIIQGKVNFYFFKKQLT